ncbi:transcriptional regulator [Opitutaceae bacterium TAV1]|nr:transcriptional regulator [Opitutaceae bacterium TAV1]
MKEPASSSKLPTLREIASACGYGLATVSYALRENSRIPPATRDEIRTIAQQLGWKPNPLASAYMAHFRQTRPQSYQANLAFFVDNPESGKISDQLGHTRLHYHGIYEHAKQLGYGVEVFWLHEPKLTSRRLASILRNRNIQGIFLPGRDDGQHIVKYLEWDNFTAISMGVLATNAMFHRITVDVFGGFHLVFQKLRALGYCKIAVAVSDFYDKQVNHGVYFPASYIRDCWRESCEIKFCNFKTDTLKEIPHIQNWLSEHRPEVVIGEGVTKRAIREMGWRVPQDIAIVEVDCKAFGQFAGLDQRHDLHGKIALEFLVGEIVHNKRGIPENPLMILIPGRWNDGPSAPPANLRQTTLKTVSWESE